MTQYKKIALGLAILAIAYSGNSLESFSLKESFAWLRSVASFHISLLYNNYFVQKKCPFQCILAPYKAVSVARVIIGPKGAILLMADGLHAPLYLGKIPESLDDFLDLRLAAGFNYNPFIALHTLNRWFEQWFAGLPNTIKQYERYGQIVQYNYSTTDYTAPSLIDLIRGVYNLARRDSRGEELAYVHCKAGRGRSATLVIAYLLYVYTIAEKVNPDGSCYAGKSLTDEALINALEAYVKKQRPVIGLHESQKQVLKLFYSELKKYGNFEALYEHYFDEIQKRDAEFKKPQLVT